MAFSRRASGQSHINSLVPATFIPCLTHTRALRLHQPSHRHVIHIRSFDCRQHRSFFSHKSRAVSTSQPDDEKPKASTTTSHSVRALSTAQSQSLAGIVEYIIRPMLATPTLSDELQRHSAAAPSRHPANSCLCLHAALCSPGWTTSDTAVWSGRAAAYEQRLAATTGVPHDAAVRAETGCVRGVGVRAVLPHRRSRACGRLRTI